MAVCSEPQRCAPCACDSGGGVCGARTVGCEYSLGVTYASWSCAPAVTGSPSSSLGSVSREIRSQIPCQPSWAVISRRDTYRVIV